jgi:Protein of unknown function with PCYCGC motif
MPICERVRLRYMSQAVSHIIAADHLMLEMLSMSQIFRRLSMPLLILLFVFSGLLTACGAKSSEDKHDLAMASMDGMPADVQKAPVAVQQAYQFNVANPDVMKQIPCYCGCGAMGHTSNYSCYVSGVDAGGKISYDTHALGCSICVDITQDTMRLLKQGKTVPEIKAFVDQTYAQYGSSNMP